MAQRKFLVTEAAVPFVQEGTYVFQVGFSFASEGTTVHADYRNCPHIKVTEGDIIATTNEWAGKTIAAMLVPNKTERAGKRRAVGKVNIFREVEVSTPHQHDLDPIFATAIAAMQ